MVGQHGTRDRIDCAASLLVWLARFSRDRGGSTLVTVAITLPIVIGAVGIGVETGSWYSVRRQLQTAADAAAIAGAYELARHNPTAIETSAQREADRNGYVDSASAAFVVSTPPSQGAFAGQATAVEVALSNPEALLFARFFLGDAVDIGARAVAAVQMTGSACVLALHETASGAVTNQGSTVVSMPGCIIAANSIDAESITVTGSGQLEAESLWTPGDYYSGGSASMTLAEPAVTHAWPLEDPYEDLDISVPGGCTEHNASYANETTTISPGVYCNGMSFGANAVITLQPGTYYVNQGDFRVNAEATVTCACGAGEGVTIVLTSTGSVNQIGEVRINGGASVTLNAPSDPSYDYPGILFFQDRLADPGGTNQLNGGADMRLSGAIYFPSQSVEWSGTSDTSAPTCTMIVALQVTFLGNAVLDNSGCEAAGVTPISISSVALVE